MADPLNIAELRRLLSFGLRPPIPMTVWMRLEEALPTLLDAYEERDSAWEAADKHMQRADSAEQERDRLRETVKKLNYRAQQAESIIAQSGIVEARPQGAKGRSLGRALSNYAAGMYQRERDEAREENARLREVEKDAAILRKRYAHALAMFNETEGSEWKSALTFIAPEMAALAHSLDARRT